MTVILKEQKILFTSAPKVACSSIKTALFEVENGFAFQPFHANGQYRHIHDLAVYPALEFFEIAPMDFTDFIRITMVRNPVRRFLSAYSNRVIYYREVSEQNLARHELEEGLAPDPSLREFVENLEAYRRASNSIRLHTDPLWHFLGREANFYNYIFNIRQIKEFDEVLSSLLGREFVTPHLQSGGPKLTESDLTAGERMKIEQFYHLDYEIFGQWFDW